MWQRAVIGDTSAVERIDAARTFFLDGIQFADSCCLGYKDHHFVEEETFVRPYRGERDLHFTVARKRCGIVSPCFVLQ